MPTTLARGHDTNTTGWSALESRLRRSACAGRARPVDQMAIRL